ncbi:ammonia-dependent NAD(+) synthetase [Alkalibacterium sp. AK22]|uniref:ammonia-dependent NAD(+) synthetase n=1 Tax=Alkalibacterium sp. AK22 TaxID=1229520 RepID=UPI000551826D|nr:ammonia-dependent NAD(+) synthetase [Alkalibacterium sp. AK22]
MSELQKIIVEEMRVKQTIDPAEEIRKSVDFMKVYMLKHPFLNSLILGISGGQDSTLLGKMAQMAVEELRKEQNDDRYQFIAVRLPYGEQADEVDAQAAVDWISPDRVIRVNIKPAVDAIESSLSASDFSLSDFNKGNVKARERMVVQYAIAGDAAGVVLGTDHPAEAVTGFFTKYGDGGTDILPLFRLNKSQGRQLLEELGAPEEMIGKVPTADLESDNPSQPDEVALGVTYEEIDRYLTGENVSEQAQQTIENWYTKTQHKRHLPITMFDDFWK